MLCIIREGLSRWSRHPYARFFMLLLLATAMFFGAMGNSDCDEDDASCDCSGRTSTQSKDIKGRAPKIVGYGPTTGHNRVALDVYPASEDPYDRDVIWVPPPGATDFSFSDGAEPEPGGPPFVFKDQLMGFEVSYTPPPVPPGQEEMTLTDAFQANYSDESVGVSAIDTKIKKDGQTSSRSVVPSALASPRAPSARQEADQMWHIVTAVDPPGIAVTTDLCNEWLTRLRGDEFFIGVRAPMATTAPTTSYQLPFVFGSPYSQTVSLFEWGYGQHLEVPLEYRLERLNFLTNALPSAPGEHWAALGLSSAGPTSCPEGMDMAAGEWTVEAELLLAMYDQLNNCEGCELRAYLCYEGQESPLQNGTVAAMVRATGVEAHQDEGITCLGPKTAKLTTGDGDLHLGGTASAHITPTQRVELHEHLENETGGQVTVKLDFASTVEGWQMYDGDWEAPNLGQPIPKGSEIDVGQTAPGLPQHIWLVNDVPADTPDGPHTLVLSATVPADPQLSTFDTIPLWSGDWVAPDEATCHTVTDVTIDGATAGPPGPYTFTLKSTPPTATLPITYTWEADTQTPVTHRNRGIEDSMTYIWTITGPQVITVAAANECGVEASATHTMTIKEPTSCDPITSLLPDGPPTTTVDALTIFTATVGPTTATLPITYTWRATEQTPVVHAGRDSISDTVSFTWGISGTKDVTVTAANECSEFVSAPRHVHVEDAPEEEEAWAIYLPLVTRGSD